MNRHRTGIYARISSDDGTALGVARQLQDCEALADRRGWSVVERFVDNDVSASNGRTRPEYVRLMTALETGEVDALVVWDVDRLTRTPMELEEFIVLADAKHIALASVGGEVDLGTPQGRLTARIKGSVARHEVEQQSRRLRRKFLERAEAGKPHGKVAYGYRREPLYDDAGRLAGTREVLHEEEAAVIREAARRLLDRETMRSVVMDLNARGVPSPRGGRWEATILRQVLLRQRNAGRRVHRGEVLGRGDWPPVLNEDTFDRLHALLTDPSRRTSRGAANVYLLSGIARCGRPDCGGVMRVVTRKQRGNKVQPEAYNCRTCYRVRRKLEDVDTLVEKVILGRLAMPDAPDLLAGDPVAMRDAAEQIEAIRGRMDAAADAFADGEMTREQVARTNARLRPKLEDATARLRAASPTPELARFAGPDVAQRWRDAPLSVKRALINLLVDVTILPTGAGGRFDPKSVAIHWKGQP